MKHYAVKVSEGQERNDAWREMTPAAQLRSLDARLGVGIGAKRQRAKLVAVLMVPKAPPAEVPVKEKKSKKIA